MNLLRSPDRDGLGRLRLIAAGAVVGIAALVLIGALAGASGHRTRSSTGHIPPKATPKAAASQTTPRIGAGPSAVAAGFAAAFEASSWDDSPGALAARVRPWATASLDAAVAAPDQGGPPEAFVARHSVTTAKVLGTTIDPAGPGQDLALASVRLTTVASGAAATSTEVMLPLHLSLAGARWAVDAVPGMVQ
ncbi:MAG: hypothetical protein ACRDY2_11915 [Acidimicrobiales bacterium]